jgi:dihydroneopterin aldolase
MYTVFVRGIEFYGYHGVPAEERFIGHRYRVDVEFRVDGTSDETDHISDTVDYAAVARIVTRIGSDEKAHTDEPLARLIGERILSEHEKVNSLWISVSKPLPPAPILADEAGVELELARAGSATDKG